MSINRGLTPPARRLALLPVHPANGLDDNVLGRNVLVRPTRGGLHLPDLVYHIHAFDNAAEHRVTNPVAGVGLVEEVVVLDVYEELGSGAVGIVGAGHG